jgi:phage terminase small subunit
MTEPELVEEHFDDTEDEEDDEEEFIPWAECKTVPVEYIDGRPVYNVDWDGGIMGVGEVEFRIVDQYEAARRRQAEAEALAERRWKKPPPEPDPAETAPAEPLTPRQEEFCRHYAARPVAAHAALLAGYGEENARHQGSRLLKNPLVLARIEALRAERGTRHVLEAGTLQDKLEAVFVDALTASHHAAAVAALRLQAGLARLPTRAAARDETAADLRETDPPRKANGKADKRRGRKPRKSTKAHR